VTLSGPGDPASCSRLGGALCTTAARLAERAHDLPASSREARLAGSISDRLDRAGSALQVHAQELAELTLATRALEGRITAAGLTLANGRVREPFGVTTADAASRRQAAAPDLQDQLDRIGSRLGRARAALGRSLDDASLALETTARLSRTDVAGGG
jgi:hypothetical protein